MLPYDSHSSSRRRISLSNGSTTKPHSSCREHSPKERGLRRQSTTEEILLSRGFRRQSTTEDIMRARNFRRQSTQSEEMSRSRGRRDSSAQITDGTLATMTVETSCAFFDTSTQTGKAKALRSSSSFPSFFLTSRPSVILIIQPSAPSCVSP